MRPLRLQYNAPVVLTFSLLSLGALIFGMLTGGGSTRLLFCVYRAPLTDPLTYVRMFTHVLGHANYTHFIGNIMLLLVIGPPLEEKYGSRRLLGCVVLTALISGLVQFLLFPGSALLGASGIVFMMIVLSSLAGMREGEVPLTLVLVVLLYLGGRGGGRRDRTGQRLTADPHCGRPVRCGAGLCYGPRPQDIRQK